MEAKIKATGKVIAVEPYGDEYAQIFPEGDYKVYTKQELEFLQDTERRRGMSKEKLEKRKQQMIDEARGSYPNWISIEDELPPENGKTQQSISVWATNGLTSGEFRYNFDTKTWTNVWGDPFDITHWMPLSQLPREEE